MEFETLSPLTDYEIERGKPTPSKQHARLQTRIAIYLAVHFADQYETFIGLTLDTPGEKSTPDICTYDLEPVDFFHDEIKRKEPPLVTIEILSPSQSLQTLLDKTNDYFTFGVKSCWVVIPALQSIYVFQAPQNHEVFSKGEVVHDPNFDIHIPMDLLFSTSPTGFKA